MKYSGIIRIIFSVILPGIIICSCKEEVNEIIITKEKIDGYVQKGPFFNSSPINIYELNSSLEQTGNVFNTFINNDKGLFEFNDITLSSNYVELTANGYYFNEITGDISPTQLSLSAISDLTENSLVNINVLTHLEKERVVFLVNTGMDFYEAKDSAQQQILSIFGLRNNSISQSDKLDIYSNQDGDAILLAISLILQGDLSVEDLQKLLSDISTDIAPDGILDREYILPDLRNSAKNLDLAAIRKNIEDRYQELGLTIAVPEFEGYFSDYLSFSGQRPTVNTLSAMNLTITGGTLNGLVNANNLRTSVSFEYGITNSYGQTAIPVQSLVTGNLATIVTANIIGLEGGITYHYRTKTTDDSGTTYGNDMTFKTYNTSAINDIDNNFYNIIPIGTQVWIAENLKTSNFNDGSEIPNVTNSTEWGSLTAPGYCWPDNNEAAYKTVYGAIYNWYTVNTGKLCPSGWHVPTDSEWASLISYLGGQEIAGGKLKAVGIDFWDEPNSGATNESGFGALPGGFRANDGSLLIPGYSGYWWSATEVSSSDAWRYSLSYQSSNIGWHTRNKGYGYSVRCIKD